MPVFTDHSHPLIIIDFVYLFVSFGLGSKWVIYIKLDARIAVTIEVEHLIPNIWFYCLNFSVQCCNGKFANWFMQNDGRQINQLNLHIIDDDILMYALIKFLILICDTANDTELVELENLTSITVTLQYVILDIHKHLICSECCVV